MTDIWEYSNPLFAMADPDRPGWTMMTCGHVPYSATQDILKIFVNINVTYLDSPPLLIETFAFVNYTAPNGSVTPYELRKSNYYYTGRYPVWLELPTIYYQVGTYDIVGGVGGGTCQLIVDPLQCPQPIVNFGIII